MTRRRRLSGSGGERWAGLKARPAAAAVAAAALEPKPSRAGRAGRRVNMMSVLRSNGVPTTVIGGLSPTLQRLRIHFKNQQSVKTGGGATCYM